MREWEREKSGEREREIGKRKEGEREGEKRRPREGGRFSLFLSSFLFSFELFFFLFLFSLFSNSPCYLVLSFYFRRLCIQKISERASSFVFLESEKSSLSLVSLSLSFSLSLCLSPSPSLLVSLSIRASAADLPSSSWRHRRAFPVPQEENLELAAALRTRAVMQTTPLRALLPLPRAPLPRPSRSPSPTAASSLATPRLSRACCAPW